ncbi:kelch repeat-containing protein [Streptomyces spectabilis]|uniref:Kelch repeat-containing protein n=1 Tax=Streptomyces spectabilis TaxID=68270 RepID=UPI0033D0C38B
METTRNHVRRRRVLSVGAALTAALALPSTRAVAHPGHPGPGTPAPPLPAEYGRGWQPLKPIGSGPRQEHAVAALGTRLYVVGGIHPLPDGTFETTGHVEVYDTRTRRWTRAAPLPVPMNHPNLAAVDGRLYVLGGLAGGASWQALGDSFAYDPRTDRWARVAPLPEGTERGSAAIGVHGRYVLLAGGMRTLAPVPGGLQDTVDTVSAYDVVTGRWEALPRLPEARDHVGGAVVDGVFHVLGGRDRGQENVRGEVFALDPRGRRWRTRASMPTPRGGIAAAAVGPVIYTFGGEGNPAEHTNGVFSETEAYDTVRDRWYILPSMPVPRHGTAAAAVSGTIHIPGGGTRLGGAPVDTHDAYRPRRGR